MYPSAAHNPDLKTDGYLIFEDFLPPENCQQLLNSIANFRTYHSLTEIHRPFRERSLRYYVINGEQIERHLVEIWQLYENVNSFITQVCDQHLVPLQNKMPAVNVNITKPGGEYRWHYDRNAVTTLLYLNDVEGGELELYPNYRLGNREQKFTVQQKCLDAILKPKMIRDVFSSKLSIKPRQGMMVAMHGDRCLHSVAPLQGTSERINIVMAYDTPNATFPVETTLDTYLYTTQQASPNDANYV